MEKIQKWTALYLPARPEGRPDPSRFDFDSEDEAQEYIFTRMCKSCKAQRQRALDGTSDPEDGLEQFDSLWPGCAHEWSTMLTSDYEGCETDQDVMEAAGWRVIYRKPEEAAEAPEIDLTKWPGMKDGSPQVLGLTDGPVVSTPTIITKI